MVGQKYMDDRRTDNIADSGFYKDAPPNPTKKIYVEADYHCTRSSRARHNSILSELISIFRRETKISDILLK